MQNFLICHDISDETDTLGHWMEKGRNGVRLRAARIDIYCLYKNDKIKSAIIKKNDKILYKNVQSDLDYELILESIKNKEIDEIR